IGHALARAAVQAAGPADPLQLLLQPHDALDDQPAVHLDLPLARAAHEAGSAALPLQVGPGADEPRALVAERGELDLQLAFPGAGALAEDLQDQAGAVDDLAVEALLQVALLHRGQLAVDDDDLDLALLHQLVQALDLAA